MRKLCDVTKCIGLGGSLLVSVIAMSGCATDEAPSDGSSAAIAEIGLDNGTTVSFYEPSPGAIAIGQQTAMGIAPVEISGKSAVEVYRALAPGQPVPAVLAAAQARADQAQAIHAAHPAARPGDATSSLTSSWFEANYCYDENGWSFINCHADPLLAKDLSGTHTDIDEFKVALCTDTGRVKLDVWVDGDHNFGVQVNAGNCAWYHWVSGLFNADSFTDTATILSASGVYGLAVKWNH